MSSSKPSSPVSSSSSSPKLCHYRSHRGTVGTVVVSSDSGSRVEVCFNEPKGIAHDSIDRISFVCAFGGIYRINHKANYVDLFAKMKDMLVLVTCVPVHYQTQSVYLVCCTLTNVFAVSKTGDTLRLFATTTFLRISDITFDIHGHLMVTDCFADCVYKSDKEVAIILPLAVTPDVSHELSPDVTNISTTTFNSPRSLAVDSNNHAYVVDYNNKVIRRMDATTHTLTTEIMPGIDDPNLIVCDHKSNYLFVFDDTTMCIWMISPTRQHTFIVDMDAIDRTHNMIRSFALEEDYYYCDLLRSETKHVAAMRRPDSIKTLDTPGILDIIINYARPGLYLLATIYGKNQLFRIAVGCLS